MLLRLGDGIQIHQYSTMTELSGGEIAGIVIGSLIGGVIVIGLILYLLRKWLRGPTKGSDVNVNLDNKVVVITGENFNT